MIGLIFLIFAVSSSIGAYDDDIFDMKHIKNGPILSLPNLGSANGVMIEIFKDGEFVNLTNITEIYNNKTKEVFGDNAMVA